MLRTNLDTWRATLFVSLGLAASACAGRAESRGHGVEDAEGTEGGDGAGAGGERPERPEEPVVLAEHLRCEEDNPSSFAGRATRRCANGIVHRPGPPPTPGCPECTPQGPVYISDADQCASDEDCAPGALCISSVALAEPEIECPGVAGYQIASYLFACQTPDDECGTDSQCTGGQICVIANDRRRCAIHFTCDSLGPIPGRPFLVGAEARVAGVCASVDWCGPGLAPPEELDARSLSIAARHWRSAALMEHASIAAFARFTLQLLQLGAPLALVEQSQAAMRDETEHARRCFALAARYAKASVGPTTLPLTGAFEEESLTSILRLAFREGCIGETCAALEASEALALTTDDAVRQTLALIAPDERSHAELAWRFVAWALEHDASGEARALMQDELEHLRAETAEPLHAGAACSDAEGASPLSSHGILSPQSHTELRRLAITQLVLPCAERLLAARADAHAGGRSVSPVMVPLPDLTSRAPALVTNVIGG